MRKLCGRDVIGSILSAAKMTGKGIWIIYITTLLNTDLWKGHVIGRIVLSKGQLNRAYMKEIGELTNRILLREWILSKILMGPLRLTHPINMLHGRLGQAKRTQR